MFKRIYLSNIVVLLHLQILLAGPIISSEESQQPGIAAAAPLFRLQTLQGDSLALSDLSDKFVIIHFAASWWPFCNAEAPHLEALWQKYKSRKVQVLIIDVKESHEITAKWVDRQKFSFPILLDNDGKVSASYAPPDVLPDLAREEVCIASNLIIDPKGKIQFFSLLDTKSFDAKLIVLTKRLEDLLLKYESK